MADDNNVVNDPKFAAALAANAQQANQLTPEEQARAEAFRQQIAKQSKGAPAAQAPIVAPQVQPVADNTAANIAAGAGADRGPMPYTPGTLRQGLHPILLDAIDAARGQHNMTPASNGQLSQRVSRVQGFEGFLSNFINALGQGFANQGTGPASFGRGFGAAVQAPMQRDLYLQEHGADVAEKQAHTDYLRSQTQVVDTPYGPMQANLWRVLAPTLMRTNAQRDIAGQRNDASMLLHGMKPDGNGGYTAMDPSEYPPGLASSIMHQRSLDDLNAARADYQEARAKGEPQRVAQAQQRLAMAEKNYQVRENEFMRDTFGTVNGQPVPGGATDTQGNPIGSTSPGAKSQLQTQRDDAAMSRQNARTQAQAAARAAKGPAKGYVRIMDSTGVMQDIPAGNLDAAKRRDPKLRIMLPQPQR